MSSKRLLHYHGDLSTFLGILFALLLIAGAVMWDGSWRAFLNGPSLLIVGSGTFFVTAASYSLSEVLHTLNVAFRVIFWRVESPMHAAKQSLNMAGQARKHGIIQLEKQLSGHFNPFFLKAIRLLADAIPIEEIEKTLTMDIAYAADRHTKAISVLRKMAEIAPAMGLIGTLIGLVQMLGALNDVSSIGPAMAVALLTTFYGALFAYVILLPLASRLERNSREEMLVLRIYLRAALAIAKSDHPRQLEQMINGMLPSGQRVHIHVTDEELRSKGS
jgi:chemotaxis protein MotA